MSIDKCKPSKLIIHILRGGTTEISIRCITQSKIVPLATALKGQQQLEWGETP